MAKSKVNEVDVGEAPIERFRALVGRRAWSVLDGNLAQLKSALRGRVLWNVNSTAQGGGVAEMLASLIPYDRGVGIDERWVVIEGSEDFFDATKRIHTMLHGVESDGGLLTDDERRAYDQATARNFEVLAEVIQPGDVVILQDPQTAGLTNGLSARGHTSASIRRTRSCAARGNSCARTCGMRRHTCSRVERMSGKALMSRESASWRPA